MLEQDVDEDGLLGWTRGGGEEQVAVLVGEFFVNVGTGLGGEAGPVDAGGDVAGEDVLQLGGGVFGLAEDGLEQRVVGGVGHRGSDVALGAGAGSDAFGARTPVFWGRCRRCAGPPA